MSKDEIIYKIWQRAKQLQFTSEHLAEECQTRGKDWDDIKDIFNEVTRVYKQLEEFFLLEQQKDDRWKK
jgi:hypothetical protein